MTSLPRYSNVFLTMSQGPVGGDLGGRLDTAVPLLSTLSTTALWLTLHTRSLHKTKTGITPGWQENKISNFFCLVFRKKEKKKYWSVKRSIRIIPNIIVLDMMSCASCFCSDHHHFLYYYEQPSPWIYDISLSLNIEYFINFNPSDKLSWRCLVISHL